MKKAIIYGLGDIGKGLVDFFIDYELFSNIYIIDDSFKGEYRNILVSNKLKNIEVIDYLFVSLESFEIYKKIETKLLLRGIDNSKIFHETFNYNLGKKVIEFYSLKEVIKKNFFRIFDKKELNSSYIDNFISELYLKEIPKINKGSIAVTIDHCKYERNHLFDILNNIGNKYKIVYISLDSVCEKAIFCFSKRIFDYIDKECNAIFSSHMINYKFIFAKSIVTVHSIHQVRDFKKFSIKFKKKLEMFSNFDFFLSPSNFYKSYFKEYFKRSGILKKIPKTYIVGYPKLEKNIKNYNKYMCSNNYIIYAPTHPNGLKEDFCLKEDDIVIKNAEEIISYLLKKFPRYKIIFRPHPASRELVEIEKIRNKFSKYTRFIYDLNNSYFESYSKSSLMITDYSDTAFSFSLMTNKPTIFYVPKKISKDKVFFKDINSIGSIVYNLNELEKKIKQYLKRYPSHKIKLLYNREFKEKLLEKEQIEKEFWDNI